MKKIYFLALAAFIGIDGFAQIVNIPDPNFKNVLVNVNCCFLGVGLPATDVDTNNDGEIEVSEAQAVLSMNLGMSNISSLEGIENFTALQSLSMSLNPITAADLSQMNALTHIYLASNNLSSIALPASAMFVDLSHNQLADQAFIAGLTDLHELDVRDNYLTSLDVSATGLTFLYCDHNQLASLILNPGLGYLTCSHNQLSSLDTAGNVFYGLDVSYNQLMALELNPASNFYEGGLNISGNLYTAIDLPSGLYGSFHCDNTHLVSLDFPKANPGTMEGWSANQNLDLLFLNLKNDFVDEYLYYPESDPYSLLYITGNTNLHAICLDQIEMGPNKAAWRDELKANNNPDLNFSSYCDFIDGSVNTISGNVSIDCGNNPYALTHVRLNVNGFQQGATFTDASGNYAVFENLGSVSVTPEFENPAYFSSSPASFSQNFTTLGNEVASDFCVSANGVHHDLGLALIPLDPLRPGFDASFKIVVTNVGNQSEAGNAVFTFDEAKLDFVSTDAGTFLPTAGTIVFPVSVAALQSQEISIVLNVNSPVETPAVNVGDVLDFGGSVNIVSDENPSDNTVSAHLAVVGSYDPNDKIVSEGETISISQLGDYLHYTIRFQNTGNFAAQHVVIEDLLDANLDKKDFQMISASHPYHATLTDGNRLEIFFDDIQLPAAGTDEAASHGYISYKIKPVGSIALNASIQNNANIFFDYNAPVTTNTVATTVSLLATPETATVQFDLWPNPAASEVNIRSPKVIDSVEIVNALGQTVLTKSVGETNVTLDVSKMAHGIYYVNAFCGKSRSVQKLIR